MHEMNDGLDLDQSVLITVLQNKLAQAAIREAQLEGAVQQLMNQQSELMHELQSYKQEAEVAESK